MKAKKSLYLLGFLFFFFQMQAFWTVAYSAKYDDTTSSVIQTWNLTSTLTATLNSDGVLTISTTQNAEAMPDYTHSYGKNPAPWRAVSLDILSVMIEDKVTSIGTYAFQSCDNLTSIAISNSITSIGSNAFAGCCNLTSITIPNSVTSIGEIAFPACESMTDIIVEVGNPTYSSEDGVLYNKNKTTLICYPTGKRETAFVIPNSVTSIVSHAFFFCTNLTSITIPNSVTSFGNYAFAVCESLTDVTVAWATPLSVPVPGIHYLFDHMNNISTITLHVPPGTKALYQVDPIWGAFGTIVEQAPATVAVTSVNLNKSIASLFVNDTEQLTATVAPVEATNKNVRWESGAPSIATVSTTGLVTALSEGTTIITVTTEDGYFTASCEVEVCEPAVEIQEETPVDENGKGKIVLTLTIPTDVLFSGSFRLKLPDGVQLELSLTYLTDELASQLTLTIVQEADGSWTFTITPQTLRSAMEKVYSKIVEIGYTVDETVAKGTYGATINDLSFNFDNGINITKDEIPVTITVKSQTGIHELDTDMEVDAYMYDGRLYVSSPVGETIQIYSMGGVLLYNFQKPAGKANFSVDKVQHTVLLVKGASGWVKKLGK